MYVCICNAVTDHEVIEEINNGSSSMKALRRELNVGSNCGRCTSGVKDLLKQSQRSDENNQFCPVSHGGCINAVA